MSCTIPEIESLNRLFDAAAVPQDAWTHEAHLLVGFYHVLHYGRAESTIRLRSRIITMNYIHGVPNTASRGYHETITLFWIWVIETYIGKFGGAHEESCYRQFLESPYSRADTLFRFYTKERVFSVEARAHWTTPDLLPVEPEALFGS